MDGETLGRLLVGTLTLRPYVVLFVVAFLVLGWRDLGGGRTLGWLVWGAAVAFTAEWTSTRVGVPFGLYHYTGSTADRELFVSNVPAFDFVSFPFLAYASWCLARALTGRWTGPRVAAVGGLLMMLADVVIDPLAVRGERWFLGRIFYYPEGGMYFGVPLSNFGGWLLVGWTIIGGFLAAARLRPGPPPGSPWPGAAFYYAILAFNLAVTVGIGERALAAAGILIHAAAFLVLWCGFAGDRPRAPAAGSGPGAGRAPRPLRSDAEGP
jgi:putative membrane protein